MLFVECFGTLHFLAALGAKFGVDRPAAQDEGAPLYPPGGFGPFWFIGFFRRLWFRIEVAESIGEMACVGYLMLSRSGDVLNPVREEIVGVLPHLGGGFGRRVADLAGGFDVGQMFERKRGSKNVVQHPLEPGPVRRLVDRVAEKGGESRPIQGPGLEKVGGFSLQAASSDQRFENGVAQLAEQGGLVPVPQRVIGAVGEPDAIGDENVVVDVGGNPPGRDPHGS